MIDRALALNPSFARGWLNSGWLRLWSGQPQAAIGVAYFFARRFDDAKAMPLRSLQKHFGWGPAYRFLAATYTHLGRLQEARHAVEHLKAITSLIVPAATHWRNPEHLKLFLSGLRLAAGEAT